MKERETKSKTLVLGLRMAFWVIAVLGICTVTVYVPHARADAILVVDDRSVTASAFAGWPPHGNYMDSEFCSEIPDPPFSPFNESCSEDASVFYKVLEIIVDASAGAGASQYSTVSGNHFYAQGRGWWLG